MSIQKDQLEAQALQLPVSERADLARSLIESLDTAETGDYEAEWVEEAERRCQEFRQGVTKGRTAEQVFRDAKARLG